ncbi:MAG: hypothetical protein LKJ90_00670 [Faecalibacterium sp.]|jgi:hypothetical protein|nr:hypothetical protein [Faecalibacterium sp.]
MLNVNKLINEKSLGRMLLVGIQPAYLYVDGKRSDTLVGYRYSVLLPDLDYERAQVKINGEKPLLNIEPGQTLPVQFDGLRANVYVYHDAPAVSFAADAIHPLK